MLPAVGRSLPLLVLVTLLQGFVTAPAGPIVDGLCLKVLAQRPCFVVGYFLKARSHVPDLSTDEPRRSKEGSSEAYGDQRLWSAVGWGAMALIAGKLIDVFGTNAIFLSYGFLVGLNVLVVQLFVQDIPAGPRGHQGSSVKKMSTREWLADLARFEPIWMLINLFVYGLLTSLVENYLNAARSGKVQATARDVRHKDSDVGNRQVYFFLACGDAFDVLTCSGFPCAGFRQRSKSNPRGSHCCGVLVLVQGFGMFRVLVWLARFRLSDLSFTDWIRSCAPLRYRFFKYIGDLWSKRGYSLVSVLWASEFAVASVILRRWPGFYPKPS